MHNQTKMTSFRQISDDSQLLRAINRKDKETARRLIQNSDVNINTPNQSGNTALHLAIFCFEDTEIPTMLIEKGANIRAFNQLQNTPLCNAIDYNKTELAALLIRKGALVVEKLYSVLFKAICRNNSTIIELINDRIQSDRSIDLRIPLNTAILRGNIEIIGYILPYCQFLEPSDKYIPKELVVTTDSRYKDCIELLLKWNFTISPNSNQDKDLIFTAVKKGYLPIVLQLLELGIDVNMVNPDTELNLLMVACLNRHYKIIEILLEHSANGNVKIPAIDWKILIQPRCMYCWNLTGNKNQSAYVLCLHIAILNSDSKLIEVLLRYNATIDNQAAFDSTCIAAHHGCEDIVRTFLDRGVDVTNTDSMGKSLLHYCIDLTDMSSNHDAKYNIAKMLLEKAATINIQNPGDIFASKTIKKGDYYNFRPSLDSERGFFSFDDPLLHMAIRNRLDARFIKTLLYYKFRVNAENVYGWTPLHFACRINSKYQLDNIKVLLHYNANINCSNDWITPLHIASSDYNLEVVKILLKKGANPNVMNKAGPTALHLVCQSGISSEQQESRIESMIQLLLRYKAHIEALNAKNLTPLVTAYLCGNEIAVKCLLRNHAKDDNIYSENSALFFWAIQEKNNKIIKNLIKYGANVNILNEKNQTPLQYAKQISDYLRYSYKGLIKPLQTQIIKLKVAGLNVIDQNLDLVYNYNENANGFAINILQLEEKCQREIEKMKITSTGDRNMTLHDLLIKNITILSRLDGNEEVERDLGLAVYDEAFPLYIDIIRSKVREAKIRYNVMNLARNYFHVNICNYLPYECIDSIFNYLKVEELNKFIEAMIPLNN